MREVDALYTLLRAKVLFPEDLEAFRRALAGVERGRREYMRRAWEALGRVGEHLGTGGPLGEAAEEVWPVMAYVVHLAEGRPEADLLAHRVARGELPKA